MIEYIKDSKIGVILAGVLIGSLLTLSSCAGNKITDFVSYQNPPGVQKAVGVPPKQTLTEASFTVAEWELFVTQNTNALMENVERAEEFASFFTGLLTGGLDIILSDPAIGASPWGGLAVAFLGGVTGLFFKRPGEEKRVRAEKEASFNAGQKKAKELVNG